MKIYVAGAWADRELMRVFMTKLLELKAGHEITHDWTRYELQYTDKFERNIKCAEADIAGVCNADLVVAIMTKDDYPYSGTRHELGAAFALRKLANDGILMTSPAVWIVANGNPAKDPPETWPACLQSCFESMADRYFSTTDEILELLKP